MSALIDDATVIHARVARQGLGAAAMLTCAAFVAGVASHTSLAEPSAEDHKIAFIRSGDVYAMNADGTARNA